MESVVLSLILLVTLGVLFSAIVFRDPPRLASDGLWALQANGNGFRAYDTRIAALTSRVFAWIGVLFGFGYLAGLTGSRITLVAIDLHLNGMLVVDVVANVSVGTSSLVHGIGAFSILAGYIYQATKRDKADEAATKSKPKHSAKAASKRTRRRSVEGVVRNPGNRIRLPWHASFSSKAMGILQDPDLKWTLKQPNFTYPTA